MKRFAPLLAAALLVTGVALPAAANADRGWHGHRGHRVCHTEWHHHHRVTRCMWR